MSLRPVRLARALVPARQVCRVGVTGLARAGKTALLTSIAANLLAAGSGLPVLPALSTRLAGRSFRVALSPSGADPLPRFDERAHVAALAADPPEWPARTEAVSLLSLDVDIGWPVVGALLPPQRLRLEFLDYPGEWLVDLPLVRQDFATWSKAALDGIEGRPEATEFLAFLRALPPRAPADEALARSGHALYRDTLQRLRQSGLSLLQPGRLLMPPPGPPAPWLTLFPLRGDGPLALLLRDRFAAYQDAIRRDLLSPGFGRLDALVVLADILSALHAGPAAFADAAAALSMVAATLRRRQRWAWLSTWLPLVGGLSRVAYVASKADHVAARQRGNLAALVRAMIGGGEAEAVFALASVRCTEDIVWTLDGHPVSAVRGVLAGGTQAARSYPGEVPDRLPGPEFWEHRFLSLPDFAPARLPRGGVGGVPHLDLDRLLAYLLEDFL